RKAAAGRGAGRKSKGAQRSPPKKARRETGRFFGLSRGILGCSRNSTPAPKSSQAKLAGIFPEARKNRSSLSAAHGAPCRFSRNKTRGARGSARMAGYVNERRGRCG